MQQNDPPSLNVQFTQNGVLLTTGVGLATISLLVPAHIMDELAVKWKESRKQELTIIEHVSRTKN